MGVEIVSRAGGRHVVPSQVIKLTTQLRVGVGPVTLNGIVNSILESHHDKVMSKRGSLTSIALRDGVILPVNFMSFEFAKSKDVGLGPLSGRSRP